MSLHLIHVENPNFASECQALSLAHKHLGTSQEGIGFQISGSLPPNLLPFVPPDITRAEIVLGPVTEA